MYRERPSECLFVKRDPAFPLQVLNTFQAKSHQTSGLALSELMYPIHGPDNVDVIGVEINKSILIRVNKTRNKNHQTLSRSLYSNPGTLGLLKPLKSPPAN